MLNLRLLKIRKPGIVGSEKGFTLVEVVISIALLGIVTAGLFTGLSTTSKVLLQNDSRQTAKNLAETQMEFVKSQNYNLAGGYTTAPIPPEQSGSYTASITVINGWLLIPPDYPPEDTRDSSLQKIIVTINGPDVTYILEGYKVK